MLRPATAAPTAEDIAASANKLRSRTLDMVQLSKSLTGREQQDALNVAHVASEYHCKTQHIQDLLLISSLVESEADERKIEPIINSRVKTLADTIDTAIKLVNADMAVLHNQAAILSASKLKDDLGELKELLGK